MARARRRPSHASANSGSAAEAAFLRFGNACHQAFGDHGLDLAASPLAASPDALRAAALQRLPKAEHRLVADFITALTDGSHTAAEACALWERSANDTIWMRWANADVLLHFLLSVRDTIAPDTWPATPPRFRSDAPRRPRARAPNRQRG